MAYDNYTTQALSIAITEGYVPPTATAMNTFVKTLAEALKDADNIDINMSEAIPAEEFLDYLNNIDTTGWDD